MTSLTGFNFCFTFSRKMFLFALLFIALFVRLGFWQLERAHEKQHLLMSHSKQSMRPPVIWKPGDELPSQYQPMSVDGSFMSPIFLLDNQHDNHQFGYDVISPLRLPNGSVVLIDRGFVVGDLMRQKLPVITTPNGMISVLGSAYYASKNNWVLGQAFEKKNATVTIVELVDTKLISQFLHKPVYPFIIRLKETESHGFVRHWAIVAMNPDRHYGYALQWFAFALVIVILLLYNLFKKKI